MRHWGLRNGNDPSDETGGGDWERVGDGGGVVGVTW